MSIPDSVKTVLNKADDVKLAYLFGSQATGETGPNSDYDFAVFFDPKKKDTFFERKLELIGQLVGALKTDKVDLVVLNTSQKPELNYQVIVKGKVIKELQPSKLLVESKIMSEYFDYLISLRRHGLTRV